MSERRTLRIDQAVFGSASGRHDYGLLAESPGLGRREREALSEASGLTGSAHEEHGRSEFWTAYTLDVGGARRQVFALTSILGQGGRGADHVVHLLLLDAAVMRALRGDLFLLDELGLLRRDGRKPQAGTVLGALELDIEVVEAMAARRAAVPAPLAAPVTTALAGIAAGAFGIEVNSPEEGAALCRALIAALPPDDRGLALCTRYSGQPRPTIRFGAYLAADRRAVTSVLATRLPSGGPPAAVTAWVEGATLGRDPLRGLSLRPSKPGIGFATEALGALESFAVLASGSLPEAVDAASLGRIRSLIGEPDNHRFPAVAAVGVELHVHDLQQAAAGALHQGTYEAVLSAARRATTGTAVGAAVEARLAEAVRGGQGRGDAVAVALVAVVVVRGRAQELVVLLSGFPAAAMVVARIVAANARGALEIMRSWFASWRAEADDAALSGMLELACEISPHGPEAVAVTLAAAEQAAATDGAAAQAEWSLALLRRGRQGTRPSLSAAAAARLAVAHWLLPRLSGDELREMAGLFAGDFARLTATKLAAGERLDGEALAVLLDACELRLRGQSEDGAGRAEASFPQQVALAARVAEAASRALARGEGAPMASALTWLLWHASRLSPPIAHPADGDETRWMDALDIVARAGDEDDADLAVWCAFRFSQLYDYRPPAEGAGQLRGRALSRAARLPEDAGFLVRCWVAHFDVPRYAALR